MFNEYWAKILHDTIIEKNGEAGMDIVYKARCTKLNRTVTLKFLPPSVLKPLMT